MAKRKSKKRQVVNQRFVKALAHELRVAILGILTERQASPNELAKMLDEGLSQVSYHVKVLKDYDLITLIKTEPRRGAVEHYYRATASTLLPAEAWRGIDGGLRTAVGAGLASELFDGLADAVEASKLTEADTHIGRTLLVLDAEGWENVRASAERFTKQVEKEQRESAARVAKANGNAGAVKGYTVGVLAFEDSRDLSKAKPKRAKWSKATSANGKKATAKTNGAGRSRKGGKRKAKAVGR
ncbi:MAG TPA: helix-turn-helix domain-containing protein [Solirubrobacterales bacterium]|nr:helix-turn-helix domain-containing protein [Solirubrobacterales bacterium]